MTIKKISTERVETLTDDELREMAIMLDAITAKDFRAYRPHPKQKLFHMNPAKTRLLLGGNRSGKSFSGIMEDIWHLTGEYPEWYPRGLRLYPPVAGRYIATDFKKGVGGVFQPYFEQLVPRDRIRRIQKTQQGILEKIFFNNGSTLDILTNEQDVEVFEGWHGNFCHYDEPPRRDRYIASSRGLIDYGGRSWFTLTPLSAAWIFDELYEKPNKDVFAIMVDIRDNPHIKPAEIAEFESKLSDDEKEARLHGKFMHLAGVVYKEFNPEVHIIDEFYIPPDWRRIQGIDPHDRRPHAIGWYAVDPFDNIYVYDELDFRGTVAETSSAILKRENGRKMDLRFIDPNKGRSPSQVGKQGTLVDEFGRYKLYFYSGVNDDITEGHLMVQSYLKYDKAKPIDVSNRPKLYIFRKCVKHIESMTHYVWDEFRNLEDHAQKEKPKDLFKDYADLIRYCCMTKPRYRKLDVSRNNITKSITGY